MVSKFNDRVSASVSVSVFEDLRVSGSNPGRERQACYIIKFQKIYIRFDLTQIIQGYGALACTVTLQWGAPF